jgi:uncharacterized protein (DUF362 family)
VNRRGFLKLAAALSAGGLADRLPAASPQVAVPGPPGVAAGKEKPRARVVLVRARERAEGMRRALALLAPAPWKGKSFLVKPNLNSADPFPGSTHPDTLAALLRELRRGGAERLAVGDRSGMGVTGAVMEEKGILRMARELQFEALAFDDLPAREWVRQEVPGSHWSRGFALPRPALAADALVQTCCLKTHRFGGHFTLSLKNSVGLVAKRIPGDPHDYMQELHASPEQRRMIAEVNAAYRVEWVVMDGLEAFADGGPEEGRRVAPGVFLASLDRVALDAVGVAILRHHGTNATVRRGRVFEQEQIARAAELGVGVASADLIEIATGDAESAEYARPIRELLLA